MKTHATTKTELTTKWHHIDADNKVVGKVAAEVVNLLTGKHKVNYVPYLNSGDSVVVTNTKKIVLTGNKELKKLYHRHSGQVGKLKTNTAEKLRRNNPNMILFNAVKGMLPKNRLQKVRLANLHLYAGNEHPHQGQVTDK